MKPKDYPRQYVYNILQKQIRTRIYEAATLPVSKEDEAVEVAANIFWDTITENGIMHIGRTRFPDIRWFYGWRTWPMIYADSLLIHHLLGNNIQL